MIPTPDSHVQAAPTLRESLARPRFVGARRAGDASAGVIEAMGEIAGASKDAVVSLASIRPSRALTRGVAAVLPVAARAGA